ncbi:MAG: hypothetical protein K8M05_22125, partial [Deltaproteobacteria bacterium]|nr:hypothetical protein [Kofleriaceae bacterium]
MLVLGQSSHLDINWHVTFDTYYETLVEPILVDATQLLDAEPAAYYAVAEMAFVAEHLARHDGERWRRHAASGRMRVVGGAMTTPDTLLTTGETLARDYLLGSLVAERELGVRTRTAWLPDSFGHAPTVPDVLAAAGYTAVGFGRADGARHAYEVQVDGLEPIAPGVDSTAAMLRDLGSADFVWRGPGGGEVLAHYMPVRQYCHGDAIDLDGVTFAGTRLGVEHDDDPGFVRDRIAGFIAELTPYQRTPYLFVPVGCDFQRPRPRLVEYARWWNEERFEATGVWVAVATFEDYVRLVGFHRDALPALARDITPVWTGFYASRPRIKRVARAAAEALAGVEPFLAFVRPGSEALAPAWHDVVLSNHHDWITGTSTDAVTADEQLPRLEAALAVADGAWRDVLDALAARVDTLDLPAGVAVTVVNPGPVERTDVVELDAALTGPLVARAGATRSPAQV